MRLALTDLERIILCRHLFERQTFAEIGRAFGICGERARQLEARAFAKQRLSQQLPSGASGTKMHD